MSSTAPAELNAQTIIDQIEAGAIEREVVVSFARGFLPLEGNDIVAVLAYLAANDDPEIATASRTSLSEIPSRGVASLAADENVSPVILENLGRASSDVSVLSALVRNRAFSDPAVALLARIAEAAVQEVIVINQSRILRCRSILEGLLENPGLAPDVRRRALETREEFFDKKARAPVLELGIEEELADAPLDPILDLLEAAQMEPAPAEVVPIPITEAEKEDPKTQALYARILKMGIAEKVMLGFRGDRTARLLLVRERNKLVCSAAVRNPRMTDSEAEMIAGMRNVEDEVLRLIGMKREWTAKYNIALALCRNPRAPLGVVLPLINRLTLRDLKGLKDDRGVTEVVRTTARRAFDARSKKS